MFTYIIAHTVQDTPQAGIPHRIMIVAGVMRILGQTVIAEDPLITTGKTLLEFII